MTNSERASLTNISNTDRKLSFSSSPNMLSTLKIAEYLFLAAFVYAIGITKLFPGIEIAKIWALAFISIWFFLFLLNQKFLKTSNQSNLTQKAELYNSLSADHNFLENNPLTPAREKALQYCHELIEDYKKVRSSSRTIYYTLQLATVIFSGITPILVLVDKLDIGISWFKWLPVIFPAVASIVASIVTSFPFQENSVAANTSVELLEAEQEKFILGVTESYRCYDIEDETQRQLKAKQAIENFIIQVNNIHLNQVQASVQTKPSSQKTVTSTEAQSAESNEGTVNAR
ncbi:hypothetical protein NIES4071_13910 [Calothrix sp. NIES-4071]|nr:hypothetical protein NIES4071_13910 [Calothrix sp. NIES-4071]BAZ55729.1 hypothetical protein NIES4105_13860 [Calothrix sp. NIES-4105]